MLRQICLLKLALFTGCVLLVSGSVVRAHEVEAPKKWKPREADPLQVHAPSPVPDRVVLTWSEDPATTQSVSWRTDTSVLAAKAEVAVAVDHGRDLQATEFTATTVLFSAPDRASHQHTVTFTNLNPATLYAYRVGDGANWSEWFQFRTASRTTEPFSFVYFGDAQNDIKTHWSRVFREAFREAPRAAFMLHAGDLVNRGDADNEWGEWFGAPAWVNATIPVVATPGNHEYTSLGDRKLTDHWRNHFAFPENGPEGLKESAYFLDYQGARIVSLNSNERQEEQARWLRRVLNHNPCRWTILTFHHPLFSPATDRDNPELRRMWKGILDEFRVDLVLTGHDHTYARSGAVEGRAAVGTENVSKGYSQVYDPDIGTVCVVSVSGPKMYAIHDRSWARTMAVNTQLFQVITVQGDELRYEARTPTNRLVDRFILKKRPGMPNLLIESGPDRGGLQPAANAGAQRTAD